MLHLSKYNEFMHKEYIERALELAFKSVRDHGGGPFGAVIVKDGEIVGEGMNCVTSCQDPTAHAEIVAIREACRKLDSHQLAGCIIYSSCEPCPMCLGAIYWARPEALYFSASKDDASDVGFDDAFIYEEIQVSAKHRKLRTYKIEHKNALKAFNLWESLEHKISY